MLLTDLVATSAAVAATRSRLEKRALLAAALRAADPGEVEVVASFLSGGSGNGGRGSGGGPLAPFPRPRRRRRSPHATSTTPSRDSPGSPGRARRRPGPPA